mgnify:CR=1 FL=1
MSRAELTKITGKRINNPFIKEKSNKRFKKRCLYCLVTGSIVLIFLIYLVFFTQIFVIKNIKINGLSRINQEEIEKIVQDQVDSGKTFVFPQKNVVFFNKQELIEKMNVYNFSKLDVKKGPFSGIKINIEEREIAYILEEGSTFYYLDNQANLVLEQKVCSDIENSENIEVNQDNLASTSQETLENIEKRLLEAENECLKLKENILKDNFNPIIENIETSSLINFEKKQAKISKEYLDFTKKLYNDLGIESDFRAKKFVIDESRDTIKVKLYNDVLVFFSLKDDYDTQIRRFMMLRNEYRDKLKGVEYIDIRYGDKIYFR